MRRKFLRDYFEKLYKIDENECQIEPKKKRKRYDEFKKTSNIHQKHQGHFKSQSQDNFQQLNASNGHHDYYKKNYFIEDYAHCSCDIEDEDEDDRCQVEEGIDNY